MLEGVRSFEGAEFMKDELALAILLELGTRERISFPELVDKLPMDEDLLKQKLNLLEEQGFIKQNPSNISDKPFEQRKYLLGLKGILLLNKIRYEFPECNLNFKFFF